MILSSFYHFYNLKLGIALFICSTRYGLYLGRISIYIHDSDGPYGPLSFRVSFYHVSGGSVVKNPPANAGDTGDTGSIPGWKDPLEKEMATHSSILARKTPRTEEPGGLQSEGSQRVGHA